VANGYVAGTSVVGITTPDAPDAVFNIYPNPVADQCFLNVNLAEATDFMIEIYAADGRLVVSKDYGTLRGNMLLPVSTVDWTTGIYKVKIVTGDTFTTKTIVKQ
jgi:hypothetical protein